MNLSPITYTKAIGRIPLLQYFVIGPIIISSLLAVYFVGDAVRGLTAAVRTANESQSQQKPVTASIERTPLPPESVRRYRETLARLYPLVTIELTQDAKGFTVSVPDPKLYNEWLFALYSLQSNEKSVLWDVSRLCLKCGGAAAVAVVQGYTQSVKFK